MKNRTVLFAIVALIATSTLFQSCKNLVPYTDAMKAKYNWDSTDIQSIQFFLSEDLLLHYAMDKDDDNTHIQLGKIVTIDGIDYDEVLIKAGTKGVAVSFPKTGKMTVSFEISDDYALSFGVNPLKTTTAYYLLASNWKNKIGEVHYNGEIYFTGDDATNVRLLVDLKKIDNGNAKHRIAEGRDVNKINKATKHKKGRNVKKKK